MKITTLLTTTAAVAALATTPAWALPSQAPSNHGTAHAPSTTPAGPPSTTPVGPPSTTPVGPPTSAGGDHPTQSSDTSKPSASTKTPKGKAYGVQCKAESKKHVAGQKGTPFSQCVTALAKLAAGKAHSPRAACKDLSKKHVAGQKGTPFSQCVVAAAKLKHSQKQSSTTPDGSTTS